MIPRKPVTVTRFDQGSYVNGYWVEGSPSTFIINASVQPVKGADLEALTEGRRDSQIYKLYTDTKLKTVDKKNNLNADLVNIDNDDYEVMNVESWQNNLINHYKILVIKVQTKK